MKTLYILGAGASHGHGVRRSPKPPTTREFFDDRFISKLGEEYGSLLLKLVETIEGYGIPVRSGNIEKMFSMIEPVWELGNAPNRAKDFVELWLDVNTLSPLDTLRSWIVDVIHVSTTWLRSQDCPFHRSLAEHLIARGESVISFNYDLIMDVALARTGKWNIGNGYGWNSNYVLTLLESGRDFGETLLLKPHGSLNWFAWPPRVDDSDTLVRENHLDEEVQIDRHYLNVRAPIPSMIEFRDEVRGESPPLVAPKLHELMKRVQELPIEKREELAGFVKGAGLRYPKWQTFRSDLPYLVMPTPYKSIRAMSLGELQHVWQAILGAIRSAERIVSIGFSFGDPHFNSVLSEGRKTGKRIPLIVVDPIPEALTYSKNQLLQVNVTCEPYCGTLADYCRDSWV